MKNNTPAQPGRDSSRTSDSVDVPQIVHVRIESIKRDPKTQARCKTNRKTVKEYAQAIADGAVMPPVELFKDGRHYWIGDGHHRVAAMYSLGFDRVQASVRWGGWRSALLHSIKSNHAHGLRRTNADKRRAVMLLLNDPEWLQCSNHVIARVAHVSPAFVGNLRREAIRIGAIERLDTLIGADGKRQPAHHPPERTQANQHRSGVAAQAMPDVPTADLRWRRAALLLAPADGVKWPGLEFLPRHAFMGGCPDVDRPDARDPDCPACRALLALDGELDEE